MPAPLSASASAPASLAAESLMVAESIVRLMGFPRTQRFVVLGNSREEIRKFVSQDVGTIRTYLLTKCHWAYGR